MSAPGIRTMGMVATTRRAGPGVAWRGLLAAALMLAALAAPAAAQRFPALTGRVVDAAHVLGPGVPDKLAAGLKVLEDRTSHQLVVATVPSLEGRSVEDYANRLFRAWNLGRKDKNDGVLLLIAPTERKLRIEVGYGLEGVLPDAIAKVIIDEFMVPQLRVGRIDAAVTAGVERISDVISGRGAEISRIMEARATAALVDHWPWWQRLHWQVVAPVVFFPLFIILCTVFRQRREPVPAAGLRALSSDWRPSDRFGGLTDGAFSSSSGSTSSDSSSSSSGSSSSSSDSFSGGGGSSGGGGASGSW